MKIILFGATGMVGQGVLRACLLADDVESVLVVGRTPTGRHDPKLRELLQPDLTDLSGVRDQLAGYDACFFCLGVTSAGMNEAEYTRVTYDLTMAAARPLARLNPDLTFVYVSGAGTDSTERGRSMWARVKGRTENAVLDLFPNGYAVRPAAIQPVHGERSKTRWYRLAYVVATPLFWLLRAVAPRYVTTTEELAGAMLGLARDGYPRRVLESVDFRQ
ncbi:NAD-dependent epimerase/dehydratase family protein [Longispora sp. NPDC051575]|uniref:NAD-dependent epimerase/dehydratase family protein n=1 Tax=Longispora sp. NPDC051575 TaxID=3154943 RepID=UPI003415F10A